MKFKMPFMGKSKTEERLARIENATSILWGFDYEKPNILQRLENIESNIELLQKYLGVEKTTVQEKTYYKRTTKNKGAK